MLLSDIRTEWCVVSTVTLTVAMPRVGEHTTTDALIGATVS